VVQLNSTSARIGTSAATPADGTVHIGDSTTTPLAGADDLIIARGSNDAGVTIRTATTATGQICFADGNTGNEQYRGFIGYAHGTDKLNLGSGGSTAMSINSSGNVTVGGGTASSLVSGGDSPVLSIGATDASLQTTHKAGSLVFLTNDADYTGTYADGITGEIVSVSESSTGAAYGLAFYTGTIASSNRAERFRIASSGHVLVGTAALDANVGAKRFQLEGSASTSVGPEMLLHNPAQGGGAASLLTFGGKASGTEGYTAAIKATNTGTLTIGTSSASGGFSEPAADLTISSTGLATFSAGITVSGGITSIGSSTELTVSSGLVTVTNSFHTIDTENNDATDSLATINGGVDGAILVLRSQSSDRDTNIKDGIGNLRLAGDFNLLSTQKMLTLIKAGSNWYELSRSDNG
jgi:hypothetical protein